MSGSDLPALEADLKEYNLQLETIQLSLQNDPENVELQALKQEIEEVISLTESAVAELKPAPAAAPPSKPSPPPINQKWSKENHPAFQKDFRKPEAESEDTQTSFAVNDTVTARWKSGDGGFYTARITSITGSKHDPVYIVKFQKYGTIETLKTKDIKPLSAEARKRKADNISGSSTPTPQPANPTVISAAANVDTNLMNQAKREPSKVSDGPIRPAKIPRKVKQNKELEAGKTKWQDFAKNADKGKFSKSGFGKKESMFRTGDSFNARGEFSFVFR
jgi:survival of motor neuron-related-splicing factor 30